MITDYAQPPVAAADPLVANVSIVMKLSAETVGTLVITAFRLYCGMNVPAVVILKIPLMNRLYVPALVVFDAETTVSAAIDPVSGKLDEALPSDAAELKIGRAHV